MRRIITHGGDSHIDEVLACAFIATKFSIDEIIRTKDISNEEIKQSDIVVDVGGKFDGIQFFDHHQDDPLVNGECAASLVASYLTPDVLEIPLIVKLLERIKLQDNQGMAKISEEYGINRNKIVNLLGLEWVFVKYFKQEPLKSTILLADMIKILMQEENEIHRAIEWLNNDNYKIENFKEINILKINVDPSEYGIKLDALSVAQKHIIKQNNIHIIYGFDQFLNGNRMLFRTLKGEAIGIDLSRCKDNSIQFKHKNGFIIVFKPTEENKYKELLSEAL